MPSISVLSAGPKLNSPTLRMMVESAIPITMRSAAHAESVPVAESAGFLYAAMAQIENTMILMAKNMPRYHAGDEPVSPA